MNAPVTTIARHSESPSSPEVTPAPRKMESADTSVAPAAYIGSRKELSPREPNFSSIAETQGDLADTLSSSIADSSIDTSEVGVEDTTDSVNEEVTETTEDAEGEEGATSSEETAEEETTEEETGEEDASEEASAEEPEGTEESDSEEDNTEQSQSVTMGPARTGPDNDEAEGIEVLVGKLPRMHPIRTPYISGPPPQATQRRDEIIKRTGSPPDLHHAKVRQAAEQVTQAARDAQRRMITRLGVIGRDSRLSIEKMADEIMLATSAAVAQINSAIEQAKVDIEEEAAIRQDYLVDAEMIVGSRLDEHRNQVTLRIANDLRAGSDAVRELDARAQAEFTGYLAQARAGINEIPTSGKGTRVPEPPAPPGAPPRKKPKPPEDPKFRLMSDTTVPLTEFVSTSAENLSVGPQSATFYRDRATPIREGLTARNQRQLVTDTTKKAAELDSPATRSQYLINLLGLTTPVAEGHEFDRTDAEEKAENALREQMTEVEYARHRAQSTITEKMGLATEYLDTDLRKNLTNNLWKSGKNAAKSFRKQALAAEIAQQNNAATMAEAYRSLVARLDALIPKGQFLDARQLVPRLMKERDAAFVLQKQHEESAEQQGRATVTQMDGAKREQITGLQKAASESAESVHDVVTQTAFDMELFVMQVTNGMSEGGEAAMGNALDFANDTAQGILDSISGTESRGVLQIQNAAVGFLNGNINAAEQTQYARIEAFVDSMKEEGEGGQLTGPMMTAKENLRSRATKLHNYMPESASATDIAEGAAATGAGALLLGPGALVVGAVGLGVYLYEHNPDENGVITELGNIAYPGPRAIGEVFNNIGHGDLQDRIRNRLDDPEKTHALNLFSSSARVRGDTRRAIAERSTDLFGYSRDARVAALSGMSEAESNAMNPADVAATREMLETSWFERQDDVSIMLLEHNREGAVAAATRRSLDEGTRSASWGWLFTAEGARAESDRARTDAVSRMDGSLREMLSIENSFAAQMNAEEIGGSRSAMFREFASLTDPNRRDASEFSDREARDRFITYATEPHQAHLIGPGTLLAAGLTTALGPLAPLAMAAGVAADTETIETSSEATNYISAMVNNDDQNDPAIRDARSIYEIRRAEREDKSFGGLGTLSPAAQLSLSQAVENPTLSRYERDMNDPRLTPEERSRAARLFEEEQGRHRERLRVLAIGLMGDNAPPNVSPEDAETYMANRIGRLYASTDTVAQRMGLGGESHSRYGEEMVRFGRARLDTGVALASDGLGTNDSLLTHVYADRSPTEIAAANARWAEEHGGESMEDMLGITNGRYSAADAAMFAISPVGWLLTRAPETSGDLAMQLEVLARGNPTNDLERMEIAHLRQEQETRGFAFIADTWMSGTAEENQMHGTRDSVASAILTQAFANDASLRLRFDLKNPTAIYGPDGTLNPDIRTAAFDARGNFTGDRTVFGSSVSDMRMSADAYRAGVDRREAMLTTFITTMALIASIALMLIPGVNVVAAGIAVAIIAGAATIIVKAGMRGARYGWEEMATDVATTAIEAATAGVGGALAGGLGKAGMVGRLAKVGESLEKALGSKIAAAVVREAVVNAVSSAASTAIQDEVWQDGFGRGLERIANGAIRGAVVGAISGGISESITQGLGNKVNAAAQGNQAKAGMWQRIENSLGPRASEALRDAMSEGLSNGVSTLVSEAAGIGIDYAQGNFHGSFGDAIKQIGIATLRESVTGALRSGVTHINKAHYEKLMAAAQNNPHLNPAELRLLRLVGISAGVLNYDTSLKSVGDDVRLSHEIINRLPEGLRDQARSLDLNSLHAIENMLSSADTGHREGKGLDAHMNFLRGLASIAPDIDISRLAIELDNAIDARRSAVNQPLDPEISAALRNKLGGELHERIGFALDNLPVDGLQHLNDAELVHAAAMIASGEYNSAHADQLLRAAKSRNSDIDDYHFLRNLQTAVLHVQKLQTASDAVIAQRQQLAQLFPSDAARMLVGLSNEDAELAHRLLQSGNPGTPQERDALFERAKISAPELTREQFHQMMFSAAGEMRTRLAAEASVERAQREANMTHVPEGLRGTLSVLPESGLIELRLRQMEGALSPHERDRLIEMARRTTPELDVEQFSKALDQAIATPAKNTLSDTQAAELRQHLLSGVPAELHALVNNTPIMVLSAAEFEALTRSQKGQAVTLIIDGHPVVVIREGADPRVLREEGIHALQARDPNWVKHIAQLDESTLARWDELPLEQQLALYRNKVEVEIDAQQRVIKSLENDIANARTPEERIALQRQLEQAHQAHENLSGRLREVGGIDAAEMENIKAGYSEKPQYLDQPARLFSKTETLDSTIKADADADSQEAAKLRKDLLRDIPSERHSDLNKILDKLPVESLRELNNLPGEIKNNKSLLNRILLAAGQSADPIKFATGIRIVTASFSGKELGDVLVHLTKLGINDLEHTMLTIHNLSSVIKDSAELNQLILSNLQSPGKIVEKLTLLSNMVNHGASAGSVMGLNQLLHSPGGFDAAKKLDLATLARVLDITHSPTAIRQVADLISKANNAADILDALKSLNQALGPYAIHDALTLIAKGFSIELIINLGRLASLAPNDPNLPLLLSRGHDLPTTYKDSLAGGKSSTNIGNDLPALVRDRLELVERALDLQKHATNAQADVDLVGQQMTQKRQESSEYQDLMTGYEQQANAAGKSAAREHAEARRLRREGNIAEAEHAETRARQFQEDGARARKSAEEARNQVEKLHREIEVLQEKETKLISRAGDKAKTAAQAEQSLNIHRQLVEEIDAARRAIADIIQKNGGRHPPLGSAEGKAIIDLQYKIRQKIDALTNEVSAAQGWSDARKKSLRNATPSNEVRSDFYKNLPDEDTGPSGKPRDWVTGEEISAADSEIDHIYPVAKIFDEPGFKDLPLDDQLAILNMPENFAPLQGGRNGSKGDSDIASWLDGTAPQRPTLTQQQRDDAIKRETDATKAVREEIRRRLEAWRSR